jgi:hypothetical protein
VQLICGQAASRFATEDGQRPQNLAVEGAAGTLAKNPASRSLRIGEGPSGKEFMKGSEAMTGPSRERTISKMEFFRDNSRTCGLQ